MLKKIRLILCSCIILLMSNSLFSQSKLVKSVGIGGGVSIPQGGWDSGFTIRAQADFGEVLDYLFLFPYLSYSQAKKTQVNESISKDLSVQYFGGGAKLVGYINPKPRGLYVGGSLSYYYINSESFNPEHVNELSEKDKTKTTKVGFGGLVGYLFTIKSLSIFIEADYILMQGGFNNLLVFTGLNYNL